MKNLYVFLLLLILCTSSQAFASQPRVTKTAILETTALAFNFNDPSKDALNNSGHGDYRFLGLNGYTCHLPGKVGAALSSLADKYGKRCLEGTSDALESAEFKTLQDRVRLYAIAYNQALELILSKREAL